MRDASRYDVLILVTAITKYFWLETIFAILRSTCLKYRSLLECFYLLFESGHFLGYFDV